MSSTKVLADKIQKCMDDNIRIALDKAEKLNKELKELYDNDNQIIYTKEYRDLENNATNAFNEFKGMNILIIEINKIIPSEMNGGRKTRKRRKTNRRRKTRSRK